MNSIRKHEMGQFVLYDSNGEASVQLGDSIEVRLRTCNHHPWGARKGDSLDYTVEIVRSTFHNHDQVSSTNLMKLLVSTEIPNNDWKIAANVFRHGAFGQVHRLGLFKDSRGYILTINGLLWGQKILHIREIIALDP